MHFLRDGITSVRASSVPDGIAADGASTAFSHVALVSWRSSHAEMIHQVYMNGQFAGATVDPDQRQLVVHAPASLLSAVRVEVIAVEPEDAYADFSHELGQSPSDSGSVRLILLRNQDLPIGATANIYFDHGTGQIDYASALNGSPISMWPCLQDKAGFGTAQFGAGDFGYDSAAALGFGRGAFGRGQFGLDVDAIKWVSPPLPVGTYRFGVKITDSWGNESLASESEAIAVMPAARPAASLDIVTFDQQTNQLVLSVSDGI